MVAYPSGTDLHPLGELEGGGGPVQFAQDLRPALADECFQGVAALPVGGPDVSDARGGRPVRDPMAGRCVAMLWAR